MDYNRKFVVKSFKQHITEVLDKPLKWNEFMNGVYIRKASFDVGKFGYVITIKISEKKLSKRMGEKAKMSVEFTLGSEGGVSKGQGQKHDILKTGNAGAVLATVIDYTKHVVKQENIGAILFSGKEQSRKSLYRAILKRMEKLGIIKGGFKQDGKQFVAYVNKVK